jgi:hypothetical protein
MQRTGIKMVCNNVGKDNLIYIIFRQFILFVTVIFFTHTHIYLLSLWYNAKVGREDIFKPTTGNESSHEISNDNGVRVVNFATSKNLVVKSTRTGTGGGLL